MDNKDDDEKRRVMTPPEDWGDSGDSDALTGDDGWLSEPEPESADADADTPAEATPNEPETPAEPEASADEDGWLSDAGLEPAPEIAASPGGTDDPDDEPDEPEMAGLDTDFGEPDTDEEELSWLAEESVNAIEDSEALGSEPDEPPHALEPEAPEAEPSEPEALADWGEPEAPEPESEPDAPIMSEAADLEPAPPSDDWLDDDITVQAADPEPETPEPADDDGWLNTAQAAPEPPPTPLPPDPSPTPDPEASEALLTDHQVASELPPLRKTPMWSIFAVATAVVLLIVGSWGAISERTALQEQVNALQAQLANGTRQRGDMNRDQEQRLKEDNQSLRIQLATLREQYAAISSQIDNLEASVVADTGAPPELTAESMEPAVVETVVDTVADAAVETTEAAESSVEAAEAAATPEPEAEPTTVAEPVVSSEPTTPTASVAEQQPVEGNWFVNIASYSRSSLAQSWAEKVRREFPQAPQVVIQDIEVNGKALYRVRAIGLGSRADAKALAAELEPKYGIGPLWVGELSPREAEALGAGSSSNPSSSRSSDASASNSPSASSKDSAEAAGTAETGTDAVLDATENASAPAIALDPHTGPEGWFVYVDTYSAGPDADAKARELTQAGHEAKVAVEYRSGELFYRVQVVGITSREEGEQAIEDLAKLGGMPNLQLRQY